MAKSKEKSEAPANETREQRIARLRKQAADKQLELDWWPGKVNVKKAGDELVGVLLAVDLKPNKTPSGQEVMRNVYTVRRSSDGKCVQVGGVPVLDSQMRDVGAGIGDELLFLYRGKGEAGGGARSINLVAVEVIARAGEHEAGS